MTWPQRYAQPDHTQYFGVRIRDRVAYDWEGATYMGIVTGIDKHCAIGVIGEDPLIEIQLDKTGVFRTHLSKLMGCGFRRAS